MITTKSEPTDFLVRFSNGQAVALADTALAQGGGDRGFRPQELLEAALATSMNVHIRMYAQENGLPLAGVSTTVTLDRGHPEESAFHYLIDLDGPLSEGQRQQLMEAAKSCPVRKTLTRRMAFIL